MIFKNLVPAIDLDLPSGGNLNLNNGLDYKVTRLMASILNSAQMTLAEAYINGIEIPDGAIRSIWHTSMPIFFKYAPGLLAPYEWVLEESDRSAESSPELMKLHYDLPQAMLNPMLGDWKVIYPKYSMGYWENGAKDLE